MSRVLNYVVPCLGINGEHLRDFSYKVQYNSVLVTLKCQCQMFEFRGLLCRHILAVLNRMKVNQVPAYYILDRWRKDLKRGYQIFTNIYDSDVCEIERNRYNYLTPIMLEVQQLASKSQVNCSALDEVMKDMKEKFKISPNCTTDSELTKKVIHSPVKVRARGRPPTKRKQSSIEKAMKKPVPRNKDTTATSNPSLISTQEEWNPHFTAHPVSTQLSFTSLLSGQLHHVSDYMFPKDN
ncbi:protein FAR1-RELATED SEQUENCE 1-like [Impatiens glandulifera]|uniref:protein FAR1-RELATED SEQUENCE 1-like n=1 Tax=Impatiens glandulifera TaxID=253017 RepID=UPI001FB063CC|nr:protein FAR1-RELATED SEQUENCE 1-like [Impatiens glandulifera]